MKRQREGTVQHALYSLISQLPDKVNTERHVESILDTLFKVSDSSVEVKVDDSCITHVVNSIVQCASLLSPYAHHYAFLSARLNAKSSDIGRSVVRVATDDLRSALRSSEWEVAGMLVRFIAEMVNAGMVTTESFMDNLIGSFVQQVMGVNPRRKDTYLNLVIIGLFTSARAVKEWSPDRLRTVVSHLKNSKPCSTARPFHDITWGDADAADISVYQLEWYIDNLTLHIEFPKRALELQEPHLLPEFEVPPHGTRIVYSDTPVALNLFYPWDERFQMDSTTPTMPEELSSVKELDIAYFAARLTLNPADRWYITQYTYDIMFAWNSSREEEALKLKAMPCKLDFHHVVIEAILSSFAAFPTCPLAPVHYATLLVELCKLESKFMVPLMEALEIIFERLPSMERCISDRFVGLFTLLLSHFGYRWCFAEWCKTYLLGDALKAASRKLFLFEVFTGCVASAKADVIARLTTDDMAHLVPAGETHTFKWEPKNRDDNLREVVQGVLRIAQSQGANVADVLTELNKNRKITPAEKIDVVVQCALLAGVETITHQRNSMTRFKTLLLSLCEGQPTEGLKAALLESATSFWGPGAPHMRSITINQLLDLKMISARDVVAWLLSASSIKVWDRIYIWEITKSAVERLVKDVHEALADLKKNEERRAALFNEVKSQNLRDDMEESKEADQKRIEDEYVNLTTRGRKVTKLIREDLIPLLQDTVLSLLKGVANRIDFQIAEFQTDLSSQTEKAKIKHQLWLNSSLSRFTELGALYSTLFIYIPNLMEKAFNEGNSDVVKAAIAKWEYYSGSRFMVSRGFTCNLSKNVEFVELLSTFIESKMKAK